MKTKLIPAGLGVIGLALLLNLAPSLVKPAQAEPRRSAQVVILSFQYTYTSQPELAYTGYAVFNASSSDGAPVFPTYPHNTVPAAQAVADLLNSGYELVHMEDQTCTFIRH